MTQTRADSFMEALVNVAIGMGIAMPSNAVLIPMVTGQPLPLESNGALAIAYTAISLARSYLIRRAFNGRSVWQAIKDNT